MFGRPCPASGILLARVGGRYGIAYGEVLLDLVNCNVNGRSGTPQDRSFAARRYDAIRRGEPLALGRWTQPFLRLPATVTVTRGWNSWPLMPS